MPFDPNPTPDVREPTLREFTAFCRSKPAGEEYDWGSAGTCALAQFERAVGSYRGPRTVCLTARADVPRVPTELIQPLRQYPQTFGALSDRLASLSARAGEEVAR